MMIFFFYFFIFCQETWLANKPSPKDLGRTEASNSEFAAVLMKATSVSGDAW